jgi:hypothetical protein
MRAFRFLVAFVGLSATTFGYGAMGSTWITGESARHLLAGVAVVCFMLGVIGLWYRVTNPRREFAHTISATVFSYFALVFAVMATFVKPNIYSPTTWLVVVGFFALPFLVATFFLSDDKYMARVEH